MFTRLLNTLFTRLPSTVFTRLLNTLFARLLSAVFIRLLSTVFTGLLSQYSGWVEYDEVNKIMAAYSKGISHGLLLKFLYLHM